MDDIDFSSYLEYDEASPTGLRWIVDRVSGIHGNQIHVKKGDVAGGLSSSSAYYSVKINHKLYLCHRVVYKLHNSDFRGDLMVDHIDRNRVNNRIENLREVSHLTNARNHPLRKDNPYGVTGITFGGGVSSPHFRAFYQILEGGKTKSKAFSINKLGIMVAFREAVIYRQKKIDELNLQGAGYTERHGKT